MSTARWGTIILEVWIYFSMFPMSAFLKFLKQALFKMAGLPTPRMPQSAILAEESWELKSWPGWETYPELKFMLPKHRSSWYLFVIPCSRQRSWRTKKKKAAGMTPSMCPCLCYKLCIPKLNKTEVHTNRRKHWSINPFGLALFQRGPLTALIGLGDQRPAGSFAGNGWAHSQNGCQGKLSHLAVAFQSNQGSDGRNSRQMLCSEVSWFFSARSFS